MGQFQQSALGEPALIPLTCSCVVNNLLCKYFSRKLPIAFLAERRAACYKSFPSIFERTNQNADYAGHAPRYHRSTLQSWENCCMADHIDGPLYYERMGRTGPVMAFVHPNPMDQSCWIFQMAHMSTWFRCIAIDIPGYGRSPKCRKGVSMNDVAQGCWEAIDEIAPGENAILVGCSVGSAIISYMHHIRPAKTSALILSGT